MHEIIKATYDFLDELDNSDIIKNLVLYKDKVKDNKEIMNLISKGKDTSDKYIIMDIRKKIYLNDDYKNYVKYYNELFFIIMKINNYYKKLVNNRKCHKH